MSMKSVLKSTVLTVALLFSAASFAAEPTIQQVYDAANAGRLDEAQTMMQQVLQAHPESGKAHFVEAELLAKQGRFASAEAELNNADRLSPGLPKENPASVEKLRRIIADGKRHPAPAAATSYTGTAQAYNAPAAGHAGFPFGLIVVAVLLIGFIIFAVKFMANRTQPPVYMQGGGAPGFGGGMPSQPYGGMPGPMMGGGGGIGSGIVGGLVTGAALGAGMVAGEELMHHFTDGNNNANQPQRDDYVPPQNDMGGNDFGVNDTSSWDDGGGGGGGDSGGDW